VPVAWLSLCRPPSTPAPWWQSRPHSSIFIAFPPAWVTPSLQTSPSQIWSSSQAHTVSSRVGSDQHRFLLAQPQPRPTSELPMVQTAFTRDSPDPREPPAARGRLAGRTGGLQKGSDNWGGQRDWGCNPDFSIPSMVPLLPRAQVKVHFPKMPNHSFPSALLSSPSHQIPPSLCPGSGGHFHALCSGAPAPFSIIFFMKHLCFSHAHSMTRIFIFCCDAKIYPFNVTGQIGDPDTCVPAQAQPQKAILHHFPMSIHSKGPSKPCRSPRHSILDKNP